MKHILYILFAVIVMLPFAAKAQIEKVSVETYYVSDANDATDTTGINILEEGSRTYRIYIDLQQGYSIKKIYGDVNHTLRISSTANFYNNYDRPTAYFGYLINKSWFPDNPLLALDSWITLGKATKTNLGILKAEDADSSFIGGTNNFGGSAGIASGLLINSSTDVGVPLTVADGFVADNNVYSQWLDNGFKDISGNDTTVFGSLNVGSEFISHSSFLQQNAGVKGPDTVINKILIAQVTTKGNLSFELNVEVIDSLGKSIKMVASNVVLLADEVICPALTYPPQCGCKDSTYLEYNASYACDNKDSCKTLIVCGCTDKMACNYNPAANFNLTSLCCYPGYCNDRDLAVVCPDLTLGRNKQIEFTLFPNPANNNITLQVPLTAAENIRYIVYNVYGAKVIEKNMGSGSGNFSDDVAISKLESGLYLFNLFVGENRSMQKFVKN